MGGFGFAIFNAKDLDGRHWTFTQQQRHCSCGPTSVKTAKELYHNQKISEEAIRGAVGLRNLDAANTGMSLHQAALQTDFRWKQLERFRRCRSRFSLRSSRTLCALRGF
jgi:hypothetical protein